MWTQATTAGVGHILLCNSQSDLSYAGNIRKQILGTAPLTTWSWAWFSSVATVDMGGRYHPQICCTMWSHWATLFTALYYCKEMWVIFPFFCKMHGISVQDSRSVWRQFMGMSAEGITSNMLTSMLKYSLWLAQTFKMFR